MSKSKTLKSGLTPETEKRLIGDLTVPKRNNFAVSASKPPPIEHIKAGIITAPKAAEDLSKLTTVQTFDKDFCVLEKEVHDLRQLSCPPTSHIMFDSVADVRKAYHTFEMHCKTITKQKKLNAEVNKKSFDYYRNYVSNFLIFAKQMEAFNGRIHKLYSNAITNLFGKINLCVINFIEKAMKDPQGRPIVVQYRKYCEESLKNISEKVVEYAASKDFKIFDEEELNEFSESTKTFGRFFEKELAPLVLSVLQNKHKDYKSISIFHDSFVELVLYIKSAPVFVESFNHIIEVLQDCKEDVKKIKREVGDERILKKKKQLIEEKNIEEEDDIKPNLKKLVKFFEVSLDEDDYYKDSELLEFVRENAVKKLDSIKVRIKELEKEKARPIVTTAALYKEQFSDIKDFKKKLQKSVEEENNAKHMSVVNSIKELSESSTDYGDETALRQIQLISNQLKEEMENNRNKIESLKKTDERFKEILGSLRHQTLITDDEPIEELTENVIHSVKYEKEKLSNKIKETKNYLKQTVESTVALSEDKLESLDYKDLTKEMQNFSTKITEQLKMTKEECRKAENSLEKVKKELEDFDSEKDEEEFNRVNKIVQNANEKILTESEFKKDTVSFVSKVSNALKIPDFDYRISSENIDKAMKEMSLKLSNPKETADLIMNNNPSSGMFKNAARYKTMTIDVCSKLCNKTKEEIGRESFAEIKKESYDIIDDFDAIRSFKGFSKTIDNEEVSINDTTELMKKFNGEVEKSRKMNSKLAEIHEILPQINKVLQTGERDIPALKELTNKLISLKTTEKSSANELCDGVSEVIENVCNLIEKYEEEERIANMKENEEEEEEEEEEENSSSSSSDSKSSSSSSSSSSGSSSSSDDEAE